MYKKLFVFVCALFFLAGCGDNYEVGDQFFELIHENKIKEAFNMTAPEFRQSTTFDGFQYTVETYELTTIKKINWTEKQFKEFEGSLTGDLTLYGNRVLTVVLNLIKKADNWKIISIEFSDPTLTNNANLPDMANIKKLVDDTVLTFFDDVQKGSFENSYAAIAESWKLQISRDKFTETFQGFLDLPAEKKNFDYLRTIDFELLTPPQISNNENQSLLTIQGQYISGEQKTIFEIQYIYENEAWKAIGFKISTQ